ncbi:MAG: hypothetical protein RLZZ139_57, partial [Cyanobacteriota bacterium]
MLIKDKPEIPPSENPEQILPKRSITHISLPERTTSISKPKVPFWKLPAQAWNNLSVSWKLSILLLLASGLPVFVVTQILVTSSEQASLRELRTSVKEKGSFFVSEYVLWTNNEAKQDAEAIAKAIESNSFDLNDATELAAKRASLQP